MDYLRNLRRRFNNFIRITKPDIIHNHYDNPEKDKLINVLTRSEENLKTERMHLIERIKILESQIASQNNDIISVKDDCEKTKDNLYDAIYIMLGYIDDPAIKRQIDAKLKN